MLNSGNTGAPAGSILSKLGTHHFAFLRGYLEGLDPALLARRYLETAGAASSDVQAARLALRWIREQLMQAARRQGHYSEARLILIDPEKLRAPRAEVIPTLDQFREERDPHEMYSEADLLALFDEEYGHAALADRRAVRNERLRRRQLSALGALEKLLDARPALSDNVAGWLNPPLSARLRAAGILTLDDLVHRINARGYRWWTQVPRLGEKTAAQLVAWLRTDPIAQALGVRLRVQALTKTRRIAPALLQDDRPHEFGIVPLEFLSVPDSLAGESRSGDAGPSMPGMKGDKAAILAWLDLKAARAHTWRSYRKEAERFYLWTLLERSRTLGTLTREDVIAYRSFLATVGRHEGGPWPFSIPAAAWIGVRGTDRWSSDWRPFDGPLSSGSQRLAITIVAGMFRWLAAHGHLDANPWTGLSGKTVVPATVSD